MPADGLSNDTACEDCTGAESTRKKGKRKKGKESVECDKPLHVPSFNA